MKGDYPRFKATYTPEELVEHFLLTPAARAIVDTCYGDVHRHGVAVLLKAVHYLGYFPEDLWQVPEPVRTFMAHQLQLLWDHTADYPWHSRTHDRHLALIRSQRAGAFPPPRISRRWKPGSGPRGPWKPPRRKSCANVPRPTYGRSGLSSPRRQSCGGSSERRTPGPGM
jgi:hypothetical protein